MRFSGILLFFLLAISGTVAAQTFESTVGQIRVVGNGDVVKQTGFVANYNGEPRVFTALHGVAHASNKVSIFLNDDLFKLSLNLADVANDVAVFKFDRNYNGSMLDFEGSFQSGPALLSGFPIGIASLRTRSVRVGNPASQTLAEYGVLDREKWGRRDSPSLSTEVINIDGNLLNGDSGAPILNSNNKVFGIANGGFDKGRIDLGWAIPIANLRLKPVDAIFKELDRLRRRHSVDKFLFSNVDEEPDVPCSFSDLECWTAWTTEASTLISEELEHLVQECEDKPTHSEKARCRFRVDREVANQVTSCFAGLSLLTLVVDPDFCEKRGYMKGPRCKEDRNQIAADVREAFSDCDSNLFEPKFMSILRGN